MKLFDTHEHINSIDYFPDFDEVIKRAKEIGVDKMMVVGFSKETNKEALRLSSLYKGLYPTCGYHPSEVNIISLNEAREELIYYLDNKMIYAIGECGMDYHYTKEDKYLQELFFRMQIDLSYKYNIPLIIHMRDATEDTLNILIDEYKKHGKREYLGVMHCYSGSLESMKQFLKLGFYISFGGPLTYKNSKVVKECLINAPIDKILIETDSPFLPPSKKRGLRNEPMNVLDVAIEVANLKNITLDEACEITYNNACKLFNIKE